MAEQLSNELLVSLAEKFGTPLYVYDAATINKQFDRLLNAFDRSNTRFFYASKALTNINILRFIKSIGCDVDCSSLNEALMALKAGFEPANILYTSNSVHFEEIEAAKDLGLNVDIDSISNLEKFGRKFGNSYPVGIRLRPNIMAGGNLKISTGHQNSKFGIPLEHIDKVLAIVNETGLIIHGLHIHTGSEIKDVEVFAKGIEVLFEVAQHFRDLKFLDLGGGFKVPYKESDEETDIIALGKKVKEEFDSFAITYGRKLEAWFEPGKFLVSSAGLLLTKVNVLKKTPVTEFAGIDSGLNHFIRPMFYGSYHVIENVSNTEGQQKMYTVVGNICETDTFAENRLLNEIREGDYLAFQNAGAYGFEMASNYNSRFRPAEVLVVNGGSYLIRKRETLDDLLKNQIEVI